MEVPGATVVAVSDVCSERLDQLHVRYPTIKVTTDARELFTDPEIDAIFIASGSGIRRGVTLDRVRNMDVAPTIAALLGVRMSGEIEGRAISGILDGK